MRTRKAISILAFAAILAACTPNGGIIYYVLENELAQPATGLGASGTKLTVQDVVSLLGRYYAAAGKIWSAPSVNVSSDPSQIRFNWTAEVNPTPSALCTAMAVLGTNLYAGFIDTTGASVGLFRTDGTRVSGNLVWTEVTTPLGHAEQIDRLIVPPSADRILVITSVPVLPPPLPPPNNHTYNLYVTLDGSSFTPLLTNSPTLIGDATYDHVTPNYWAVSGTSILSGTSNPLGAVTGPTLTTAAGEVFQAVTFVSATNKILVAGKVNGIFSTDRTTISWSSLAADVQSAKAVSYLTLSSVMNPSSGSNKVLAGADGYGYYLYDGTTPLAITNYPDGTTSTSRYSNLSLALYTSAVRRFFLDFSTNLAFSGTSGAGLWAGSWSPGDGTVQGCITKWTRQ